MSADDIIVFCDSDCEQMVNLCCVLTWFETVLGLKVNLAKSSLIPLGEVESIQLLAGVLGCNIDSSPTTYLGLHPEKRLLAWKSKYLLKRGR